MASRATVGMPKQAAYGAPAMATGTQARQQLTPGDRAPNVFLPDQRDVIISLHDKARGGSIFVLLYPTQKDPGCAAELESLFALAPPMASAP